MGYLISKEDDHINIHNMDKSYSVYYKETQKHAHINIVSFIKSSNMDKTILVLEESGSTWLEPVVVEIIFGY